MCKAFSLVELSIVLVILGLLVGGVLAGQSLIRAAELRSVSTEYSRYTTAMSAFRDKYLALPGDMNNATSFWTAGTCPGTNVNTTSPQANTCNGDGDGTIEQAEASSTTSNGCFRFWQHLALAGLVEGSFTGVPDSATYGAGTSSFVTPNIPRSKLSSAGWGIQYIGSITDSGSTFYYGGEYGNGFYFGAVSTGHPTVALLKAEEAWNLDTKLDDGKPATGSLVTLEGQGSVAASSGCANLASATTSLAAATYRLDTSSANCSFVMKTGH